MERFGMEFTIEDPAGEARLELKELRAVLDQVQAAIRPARPGLFQRVGGAISGAVKGWRAAGREAPAAAKPRPAGTTRPISVEAADILSREPLFLDVESTDKYKKDDRRACEVAVIDGEGRVIFSTLVNPQKPISAEASAKNGIYDRDVVDAPTWRQIEPLLKQALDGRVVVAHNADFDASFLPAWNITWACSKKLADRALGKADWWEVQQEPLRGGSLAARLHQCGLEPGPAHTAAGDCLSTLRLVRYLAGSQWAGPVELKY